MTLNRQQFTTTAMAALVVLTTLCCHAAAEILHPKMASSEVTADSPPFEPDVAAAFRHESDRAVFLGPCRPHTAPFVFKASAGGGEGFVGVMQSPEQKVGLAFVAASPQDSRIDIFENKQSNVFGALYDAGMHDEGNVAIPFSFFVSSPEGAEIAVSCEQETDILVVFRDESILPMVQMKMEVVDHSRAIVRLENGLVAEAPIRGRAYKDKHASHDSPGASSASSLVAFDSASETEIAIDFADASQKESDEIIALGLQLRDDAGRLVQRTVLLQQQAHNSQPAFLASLTVNQASVTKEGDIDMTLGGAHRLRASGDSILFVTRIAIATNNENTIVDVVDVRAMLPLRSDDDERHTLTIHGGWIRREAARRGLTGKDGWDVVLQDAYVADPQNLYQVLARLDSRRVNLHLMQGPHHEKIKNQLPTEEERKVSKDMNQGRAPEHFQKNQGQLRGRTRNEKKLIVHGYCSGVETFPMKHFTDALRFEDPNKNRSHQSFATLIHEFASKSLVDGCGIVAHSQGGAAALHLYTFYWSCLDFATRREHGRMIQSVGTPYQGTPLAGYLALLASIFGVGCGRVNDLTTSGAAVWLSGIPDWAREKVNYYTTGFEDRGFFSHCHMATSLTFLSNPDDGTTELKRGQLPGGIDRGHKDGQCHTRDMRDPFQCEDERRNDEMNAQAQY